MHGRITRKPWFGPKKGIGWGWRMLSWEGAVATAIFTLLVVMSVLIWRGSSVVPVVVLLALYFGMVLLTGDPPGGPSDNSTSRTRDT